MSSRQSVPPNPKGRNSQSREPSFLPRFPANFSLEFSDWVLGEFAGDDTVVLDPFCGSATTLVSANSRGLRCVGLELNPVWVIYGRARMVTMAARLEQDVTRLLKKLSSRSGILSEPDLAELFSGILEVKNPHNLGATELVAAAVLMHARKKYRPRYGMNHSWPRIDGGLRVALDVSGMSAVLIRALKHADWMRLCYPSGPGTDLWLADARETERFVEDASMILTSPPYLSRLDYVRSSLPELEYLKQLGVIDDVQKLRAVQIGSVIVRGRLVKEGHSLPGECETILEKVEKHPSKGSRSYYVKFIRNYLRSMYEALKSITVASREDARLVLVAQESWYKDFLLPTTTLLAQMLESEGWWRESEWRFKVGSTLGLLNPYFRNWRKDSKLRESVMLFSRVGNAT